MPKDNIQELWIYKAGTAGYPGSGTSMGTTCTDPCVVYHWDPSGNKFIYSSGTWLSSSVNACAGKDASGNERGDYVGVYLKAKHNAITGLFGTGWSVTDRAVMKFEPVTNKTCLPT